MRLCVAIIISAFMCRNNRFGIQHSARSVSGANIRDVTLGVCTYVVAHARRAADIYYNAYGTWHVFVYIHIHTACAMHEYI
jgi:hypothetical protein